MLQLLHVCPMHTMEESIQEKKKSEEFFISILKKYSFSV